MHLPVLATEAIEALAIRADGVYVDGTFGRGGHSQLILERLGPRDSEALPVVHADTAQPLERCRTIHLDADRLEAQGVPDFVEGGRQRAMDRIAGESPDDMPGDLQVVGPESPEQGERRHPAAAMLERGLAAGHPKIVEEAAARRRMGDHGRFADLEAHGVWRYAGPGELLPHQLEYFPPGDRLVIEVDRYGHMLQAGMHQLPIG